MVLTTNKQRGNAGLALAISYFGCNGYTISIPLNDTQWYDLIVEKDGVFQTVQCKFTSSSNGEVKLVSTGGTKGSVYGSLLDSPLDLLFCANQDGEMWVIPMKDLIEAGNKNAIKLRKEKSIYANKCAFDTSPYYVTL